MSKTFACATIAIALVAITVPAEAKGCIKGALVGGASLDPVSFAAIVNY